MGRSVARTTAQRTDRSAQLAVLVASREQTACRVATAAVSGQMVVLTGSTGAGRTAVMSRVAQLHDGPVLYGGGLAGLRAVPNLALSRALRLPVPPEDVTRAADFVIAAAGRSTMLMLDDLHLCDPTTLEVVALLAGQLPIVVAVTDDTGPGARLATALSCLPSTIREALAPLAEQEAHEVARGACRSSTPGAVRSIVRAAGGNPAALIAMAHDPYASELRVAVANRLALLGPEARTVLCLLGLLGHPVDTELLGRPLAEAAVAAGVVVDRDGWLSARSNLDVEVALAVLPASQRRSLHALLARRVHDLGEQARHFEAAGEPAAAVTAAREAANSATSVIEQIQNQAIAARLTAGPGRTEACLVVAMAASDVADHRLAVAMAAAAGASTDTRVALIDARAALAVGDSAGALAHLDLLDGYPPNEDMALLVGLERARALCLLDPIEAMRVAADVYGEARSERDRARAGGVLGAAQLSSGADGWSVTLEAAEAHARHCGLDDVAFAAAANRCSGLLRHGRADEAFELARASASGAEEIGARSWAAWFETVCLWVTVQVRAALSEGVNTGEALLDGALVSVLRQEVTAQVALAYADGGQFASARAHIDGAETAVDDLLGWCDAELDALGGDRRSAGAKATMVLHRAKRWPVPAFAAVTAAWAGVSVGEGVGPDRSVGGAAVEVAALAARDSHPDRAAELFREAATRWEGLSRRSVLRCRLAAATACAGGDRQGALLELRSLARDLEREELVVLLGQITRARRQLGDSELPQVATGPRGATLSRREAQVLAAVAEGATSAAIAGRLGVALSTVETHVKSAMRKLGATTRTEAAARALQ